MILLHEHFKRTLGRHRARFVDDYYVSSAKNLSKRLHQPTKHEANPILVGSLLLGSGDLIIQGISVILDEKASRADERFKLFTFQASPVRSASQAESEPVCEYGYYTATSADGIHWRCCDTPVLSKRHHDPRMSDCNTCMYDPLGNRFVAFTKRHIPRGDGTGGETGVLQTRPLIFSAGRRLGVNAEASRGSLHVEVIAVTEDPAAELQDWGIQDGEPIAGFAISTCLPLTADSTDHAVTWTHGGDFADLRDRLVAFRFHLRNASLYSFWID